MPADIKNKGGRPKKTGMDYFPYYHDLLSNDKIKKAKEIVDTTGIDIQSRMNVKLVVVSLISHIFKTGYYIEFNETSICNAVEDGISYKFIKPLISAIFDAGILNKSMFEKYNILTSRGIQQKWMKISKSVNRNTPEIQKIHYIKSDKNIYHPDGSLTELGKKSGKIKKDKVIKPEVLKNKPIIPVFDNEEIDHAEGNWNLEVEIKLCRKYYMDNPYFNDDRMIGFELIKKNCMDLPEDEVWERLAGWIMKFNESIFSQTPKRRMRGKESYVQHFHNWMRKDKNLSENPTKVKLKPATEPQAKTAKQILKERGLN